MRRIESVKNGGNETSVAIDVDRYESFAVTMGSETFSPISYNSFTVGPFSLTVRIMRGESFEGAFDTAMEKLEALFKREYETKLAEHLERVKKAALTVRSK
jgi:hypothetical protein